MKRTPIVLNLLAASLASCAVPAGPPPVPPQTIDARPLDSLPADAEVSMVRKDLIATAADRFGAVRLAEARAVATHLIAKRFAGMAPPPPPGAGPDWRAPTPAVLMVRRASGWMVATESGWRPANAEAATELDRIIGLPAFWSEPAYTPPCPDFGASLLLLQVPGRPETVRNSTCSSRASQAVEAALRA